jgi:hypothetical protein
MRKKNFRTCHIIVTESQREILTDLNKNKCIHENLARIIESYNPTLLEMYEEQVRITQVWKAKYEHTLVDEPKALEQWITNKQ